jgi:hypothetical protein
MSIVFLATKDKNIVIETSLNNYLTISPDKEFSIQGDATKISIELTRYIVGSQVQESEIWGIYVCNSTIYICGINDLPDKPVIFKMQFNSKTNELDLDWSGKKSHHWDLFQEAATKCMKLQCFW